MSKRPGDRVRNDGARRVVVRVVMSDDGEELTVLRYPDGDPLRILNPAGGDVHLTAVRADEFVDEGE